MPMNQLQLVLLAIAAVLLLALYVWSKWQERRTLRRFEQSLQAGVSDALLSPNPAIPGGSQFRQVFNAELHALRREPTFAGSLTAHADDAPAVPEDIHAQEPVSDSPPAPVPEAPDELEWIEDPLIDCVIELRCAHAADGVGVFDAAAPLGQAQLPLPVHLVAWDARSERWVRPDRFGFYTELLVAVQLAHRRAQLGEIEVARFLSAVEQVAVRLDADFDAPEAAHIQKLSGQLAQTCARFDVQVGLTLESTTGPWDATRLAHALGACGLVRMTQPVQPGQIAAHWVYRDAAGRVLFSLAPSSLLADRLALELDVPMAPMEADPLRQMFSTAQQLAVNLQAHVVDDNGRLIDAAALAAIEAQLQSLLIEMRAAGIEPGGARAQRLYGPLN